MHTYNVDIGIFTESWLNDDMPSDAVAIDGYYVLRKDRDKCKGGGIICYSKVQPHPITVDDQAVPALSVCNTEFLPLFFKSLSLLVICIYHPFWNDPDEHEAAICCVTDLIDYVAVHETCNSDLRVVLLGDFNDLKKYYDDISDVTQLKALVNFPTRGDSILDQIFRIWTVTKCLSFFLHLVGRTILLFCGNLF